MGKVARRIARLVAESRPSAQRHKATLLSQRSMAERRETSLEVRPEGLIFDRSDWVSAWLDPRQSVISATGVVTATRGITIGGRLLWLVRKAGLDRAYHSRQADPIAAMAEAETAWRRRIELRPFRAEVRQIVRDLRWFRRRLDIYVEDAYRSPLCNEGVDAFLASLGISGLRRYPGWLIAWAYALDRQVGFVIWEAHLRDKGVEVPRKRDSLPY